MKRRMRWILGVMLAGIAWPLVAMGATFTLTSEGKPAATIVIAADPSPAAKFGAQELREHVERITGVLLPIANDDAQVEGAKVLVGESKATRALGLGATEFKTQEYIIQFLPDTLALLGKDTPPDDAVRNRFHYIDGKFGNALQFDGEKDVLAVPECPFNDEAGTLEAWVWLPQEPQAGNHGTILRIDGGGPWTYHIIQRDMGSRALSYTTYDGAVCHGVTSGELNEGWHHVAGVYDVKSGTMALFVDGAKQGETRYVRTACKDTALGIGAMPPQGGQRPGNPFKGLIDEVRISRTVRPMDANSAHGPYEPDADTIALFHFDEQHGTPNNGIPGTADATPPELFGDNGSLYAVYDFLERFCDVRWYAPTGIGLVLPTTPSLTVTGEDLRHAPAMIHRWITPTALYLPGPPETVPAKDINVWKLRMRIGGQAFSVSHSFYGYCDRFLKEHPDWFAQGYPGQPPQLCFSNPDLIQQVVQDARDYFDGKGAKTGATAAGDVFGLVPMDNNQWCKCPRCQAEINGAEASNQQFSNGKASDYVFNFVNNVAREVHKTHPDKWIGALAYADYAYYPAHIEVEPNVVIQTCLHVRNWWCPSMEVNDTKILREWRAKGPDRPLYLWLYYCFPALNAQYGNYHYFPGYSAHRMVQQMKMYQQAGVKGIFMEHSGEFGQSYLMDQLEFYVTLKLADRPELDGNALIDEFFARYYGAAAKPMRELYGRIEDTFSNPKYYPVEIQQSPAHQHQTEMLAWDALGTEERMDEFAALMQQARDAAQTPVEKARVALFEKGQWDYMLEGRRKHLANPIESQSAPKR